MAKPLLTDVFKEIQETENRYQAKLQTLKKMQEEFEKVEAKNTSIKKKIKELESESAKYLDLIADEKMQVMTYQIENTVLKKQIASEDQLNIDLKEKMALSERNEFAAIDHCQKAISDHLNKFGVQGSVIQEKVYVDSESELEIQKLLKEKEKIVAHILELKKKEKMCKELEEKKIELLKTLDLKHKNRITHEKEIQQIDDEILGLKKELETREIKRKSDEAKKETTRVVIETKIETREVLSMYTEKAIPTVERNSFGGKGSKRSFQSSSNTSEQKRAAHTSGSGTLDRWLQPVVGNNAKTKQNMDKETGKGSGWLVLPKQEGKNSEKPKDDGTETPGTGLVVPPNVAKISNETMQEIAQNYDINNAPAFMIAFFREMAASRKMASQNKKQ